MNAQNCSQKKLCENINPTGKCSFKKIKHLVMINKLHLGEITKAKKNQQWYDNSKDTLSIQNIKFRTLSCYTSQVKLQTRNFFRHRVKCIEEKFVTKVDESWLKIINKAIVKFHPLFIENFSNIFPYIYTINDRRTENFTEFTP